MPYESKILEKLGLEVPVLKGFRSLVEDLLFYTIQYDRLAAFNPCCTNYKILEWVRHTKKEIL